MKKKQKRSDVSVNLELQKRITAAGDITKENVAKISVEEEQVKKKVAELSTMLRTLKAEKSATIVDGEARKNKAVSVFTLDKIRQILNLPVSVEDFNESGGNVHATITKAILVDKKGDRLIPETVTHETAEGLVKNPKKLLRKIVETTELYDEFLTISNSQILAALKARKTLSNEFSKAQFKRPLKKLSYSVTDGLGANSLWTSCQDLDSLNTEINTFQSALRNEIEEIKTALPKGIISYCGLDSSGFRGNNGIYYLVTADKTHIIIDPKKFKARVKPGLTISQLFARGSLLYFSIDNDTFSKFLSAVHGVQKNQYCHSFGRRIGDAMREFGIITAITGISGVVAGLIAKILTTHGTISSQWKTSMDLQIPVPQNAEKIVTEYSNEVGVEVGVYVMAIVLAVLAVIGTYKAAPVIVDFAKAEYTLIKHKSLIANCLRGISKDPVSVARIIASL